ncbi:hypothetical protein B0H63DRAFT_155613 [Podospora didyma]|uniref:Uncharacterized protein n=1 Tax=Podospora didyma TaxID=330526 RepID=A0AAE0NT89_9PEZI|nr:hypothetical protein B0H63DRAFT_155613 [Podospora didyma]
MAKVVHMPVRSRYRILLLACATVSAIYLFSAARDQNTNGRFSISAASVIEWSTGHLPPLRGENGELWGYSMAPPPPPPEDPKKAKKNKSKGKNSNAAAEKGKGNGGGKATSPEKKEPGPQNQVPAASLEADFFSWGKEGSEFTSPGPKPPYKPARDPGPPIPDPFPLLSSPQLQSRAKRSALLRAPEVNRPPTPPSHYPEDTPLLIGFTRNWPQLLQCLVSYIAAGWPPEDVYVVENTGVMYANREGRLTLQNPFYLNHTQLEMLGVNILVTPTLLTFAQLQNYFAWTALDRNWTEYFWTHQDLLVFSFEDEAPETPPSDDEEKTYYSLYERCVGVLQYLRQPGIPKWANHFFSYDHLTLVHRDAILEVGGWDTHIPFYATDCDMYVRLMWAGYWQGETTVGIILDVATVLDDVGALFRIPGIKASFAGDPGPEGGELGEDGRPSPGPRTKEEEKERRKLVGKQGETWHHLVEVGRRMEEAKYTDGGTWRNTWQLRQSGGQGEPFARDAEGFETGLHMMIDTGRSVFAEKWGHRGCDIAKMGVRADDAWKLEKDWDPETEGLGYQGEEW